MPRCLTMSGSPSRRRCGCQWTARLQEAWVPGYQAKGAQPHPAGREGRTGRNQESCQRAGCVQPLCRALKHSGLLLGRPPGRQPHMHPLHSAGSLPRVKRLPLGAPCARPPSKASGPGGRAAQGPLGLSVPRKLEGCPAKRPPTHTHTHTHSPTPPSQQAPGSPGLSLTLLGDAVLQGGPC